MSVHGFGVQIVLHQGGEDVVCCAGEGLHDGVGWDQEIVCLSGLSKHLIYVT